MASKKVNIQIDTRADTSGAKKTEDAIDKMVDSVDQAEVAVENLTDAVDKLDRNLDDVDRSTKVVDRAVDGLTDSVVKLDDRVEDASVSADRLDDSLAKIDRDGRNASARIEEVSQASSRAAKSTEAAAKGTSKIGTVATQAGFQVQDFAVQIAGGTSALTAMAQQAPQFLGVFGPGGAIAGALIAVGAVATKVFMTMADDSAAAAENAAVLADAVEQIGENASKAIGEDIDFGLQKMADSAQKAEDLIGVLNRVKDAQNAASLAAITDAEKVRSAESQLSSLLGNKVDAAKEIEAQLAAEAAQREEIARQQIEAQQRALAEAQQREVNAEKAKFDAESALRDAENLRRKDAERLELLRAQRAELEKQAQERGNLSEGDIPFLKTGLAQQAQKQLDQGVLQAEINKLEGNINEFDKQIAERTGKLSQAVQIATAAFEKAGTEVDVIEQVFATEVPRIKQTFQAEGVKAQVQGLAEVSKAAAEEISALAESAKPETTGQAAALETLKQATADGKITADETVKVAAALQTLNGVIGTNMQTSATNVQTLIQMMNTLNARVLEQKRQIDSLNARIRSGN